MRRRLLPIVLAAIVVAIAMWQRSRRRAAALLAAAEPPAVPVSGTQELTIAPPLLLEAGATTVADDDAGISRHTVVLDLKTDPQVERESSPLERRFVSIAWEPVPDPPPPTSAALTLRFELPDPGMALDRVDVRETGSQVFVTVLARLDPAHGAHTAEPAREPHETTVALREPLGDRTVVHAPTDLPPR